MISMSSVRNVTYRYKPSRFVVVFFDNKKQPSDLTAVVSVADHVVDQTDVRDRRGVVAGAVGRGVLRGAGRDQETRESGLLPDRSPRPGNHGHRHRHDRQPVQVRRGPVQFQEERHRQPEQRG